MIQCEGQLSLMDLLSLIAADNEPPRLLREGQTVYKAVRGDVETHIVTGETWTCGEGNRGYRLKRMGGCWDCTWNIQINKVVEQLEELTEEECTLHECGIRSERCKPCIAKRAIEIVKGGGVDV